MPDVIFASKDLIPAGLEEHSKENPEDGTFTVNVVPKVKIDEFREKNIAQSKELEAASVVAAQWVNTFGPIEDFDEARTAQEELKETAQKVLDGKLKATNDVEVEVVKRTEKMKSEYERQLATAAKERAEALTIAKAAEGKYKRSVVDSHVTTAVLKEDSGVDTSALSDILSRARGIFAVNDEDGSLVAKDGDATIYGADGATPMTPSEWLVSLKETAPYFFKRSVGGDANGNDKSGKPAAHGGMSKEEWDKLPGATKLELARKAENKAA